MDEKLDALRDELAELVDEAEGLVTAAEKESRENTPEECDKLTKLKGQVAEKRKQIEAREAVAFIRTGPGLSTIKPPQPAAQDTLGDKPKRTVIPATARRPVELRCFRDTPGITCERPAEERAYRFGRFLLAVAGSQRNQRWCSDNITEYRLFQEDLNPVGGYLVPEEFGTDLIRLVEERGTFRRYARNVPMMSDTRTDPRRATGLTAYFVDEAAAATESTGSYDQVRLVAKKVMAVTRSTKELNEDAAISIGDQIATELAYAFASKEDDCGWNGDGTSTYAGIQGIKTKVAAATATISTAASGNDTWPEITVGDLTAMIGLLPQYADNGDAAFYCHRAFWGGVIERLAAAGGGNTIQTLSGSLQPSFLGYPVRIVQVLPSSTAAATVCCYFGNLPMAASFGDRRGITVSTSDVASVGGQSTFERDQIAWKATARWDINVHDVGDTTNAGPIVALKTAS